LLGAKTAQIADLNKKVEALQAIKSFSNCCAQGTSTVSSSVLIGQQQGALSKVINTAGSGSKMILDWLNPLTWFSK
jgi:hypothetical protein